tara:strand:+ start:831 stop:1130 length:300 start_codon:yes stop_codon:yes gene_type:complete
MGKRKRRLHSPKYAKKYASVRETYNRLRGVIKEAEADNVVTEEEAAEIKQAKEEVVEAVVQTVAKEAAEVVEKVEEAVRPVQRKMPIKPRASKRKTRKK